MMYWIDLEVTVIYVYKLFLYAIQRTSTMYAIRNVCIVMFNILTMAWFKLVVWVFCLHFYTQVAALGSKLTVQLHRIYWYWKWLDQNTLTRNVTKSKLKPLFWGETCIKIDDNASATCSCGKLECVKQVLYLGIIVYRNFSWAPRVLYLKRRLCKFIFAF